MLPGGIRINIHPSDDWVPQKPDQAAPNRRIYVCKPLACFNRSVVQIDSAPTLARHPDPRALEEMARVGLPKAIAAASAPETVLTEGKVVTKVTSSRVTELDGYPAIVIEMTRSVSPKPEYRALAQIFAGPTMMTVSSVSTDEEEARQHLAQFVRSMTFIEGPALPDASPPDRPTPGKRPLSTQL